MLFRRASRTSTSAEVNGRDVTAWPTTQAAATTTATYLGPRQETTDGQRGRSLPNDRTLDHLGAESRWTHRLLNETPKACATTGRTCGGWTSGKTAWLIHGPIVSTWQANDAHLPESWYLDGGSRRSWLSRCQLATLRCPLRPACPP
jgi:hypothetical protein